ncbi:MULTISPECIES: hypothetical protein [unclassified Streptomyces]|uniref:hypothetical protein n=1 Tax=Streptomyces sp. NPDC127532 TaxID=3345399 RepID=UPI00362644F3
MQNRAEPAVARSDWYVRARVRIIRDHTAVTADPPVHRHFTQGEELTLTQWGTAGHPVSDTWWTSQNTKTAHTVPGDHVIVLRIIDETSPAG